MAFRPVILWTDALVYLLVIAVIAAFVYVRRHEHLRQPWRRVAHSAPGMMGLVVLFFFVVLGLLDSLHFRARLDDSKLSWCVRRHYWNSGWARVVDCVLSRPSAHRRLR